MIVPFRGSPAALADLRRRLGELALRPGDTALVVDNGPEPCPRRTGRCPCTGPGRSPTPAFARNAGARRGSADWLVFCDADTDAPPGLLDHYFDPPPAERTGAARRRRGGRAGARGRAALVARYGHLRGVMSQEDTFDFGDRWGYPKTANVACRRAAFEQVGGFTRGDPRRPRTPT